MRPRIISLLVFAAFTLAISLNANVFAQRAFTPLPPGVLQPPVLPQNPPVQAPSSEPEVDTDSVIRRGDHVERVGGFQQSPLDAAIEDVTGPPADDSHKWFITIISSRNCAPCKKLLADWDKSPELLAFAKPNDPKNSWASLNVYEVENRFHNWFVKDIKIEGTPTILIQPPRTKKYGDPAILVYQKTGYEGKPDELAKSFTAAIRKHLNKLNERGELWQQREDVRHGMLSASKGYTYCAIESTESAKGYGQRRPPVPVDPPMPAPGPPDVEPAGPMVIPGEINPDAKPSPTPAPAVVPGAPAVDPHRETLTIIVEPDAVLTDEKKAETKRGIKLLRKWYPNATARVVTPEQAKIEFPAIDTNGASAILTGGGKLISLIPQAIINEILKDDSQLQPLASVLLGLSGVMPYVGWGGLGAVLLYAGVKRWRKERAAKLNPEVVAPIDPNAPATPVVVEPTLGNGLLIKIIKDAVAEGMGKQ